LTRLRCGFRRWPSSVIRRVATAVGWSASVGKNHSPGFRNGKGFFQLEADPPMAGARVQDEKSGARSKEN